MKSIKSVWMLMAMATILFATSCQPTPPQGGGEQEPPVRELQVKFANMLHLPFEVEVANTVNVSAKITVLNGTLSNVNLYYTVTENEVIGDEQIVEMTPASIGYYEADIPAQAGGAIVKYWIEASGFDFEGADFNEVSDMGNYIVTGENPDTGDDPNPGDTPVVPVEDPCKAIRLNEISTGASIGEYIEIYNTSNKEVNLDGVAIYKNCDYEEPLIVLDGVTMPGESYGVLFVKQTNLTLPSAAMVLGTTDRGLASSRALCVELGRDAGATIYDTYTNTINPYTDATDWNTDPVEMEAKFFARFTDGWYSAGIQTPGDVNLDPQVKLKHQKNIALAVSDAPYVSRMGFDPTSIVEGKTLTVYAYVYSDAYSTIQSVQCSVAGSTVTLNKVDSCRYEGSCRFDSDGDYVVTVTATNNDNRKYSLDNKVMVCPANTEFAPQTAVRLNEVNTDDKYIEFYNTSNKPVNLVGMYIEKNNEDILLFINDNIVLDGHSFAVLACGAKDYSSTDYLYLGSSDKGISGKKSLCIEWMASVPEKLRVDAFCNTNDTDPRPKVTVWDDPAGVEVAISSYSAIRYQDGVVAVKSQIEGNADLPNQWFYATSGSLGSTNNNLTRKGRLKNQMATIAPVPEE